MDAIFTPYLETIETEIKKALPSVSTDGWAFCSFGEEPAAVTAGQISPLLEPTRSLVDLGGKRWRPLLLVLCAEANINKNALLTEAARAHRLSNAFHITPVVEFVHTASLIHDDIEDGSDTRRNRPAAYITYGTDTAINAGSWLYFEAPVAIDTLDAPVELKEKLYALYAMELRRLHLGQAMDISWHRDTTFLPNQEQYLAMVTNKTGTLASLAAKTGMMVSGASEDDVRTAGKAAALIGVGFQIIDDVMNLTTGNPGKKRGDDIVEGKKSLPVILYAQKYGSDSLELKKLSECFTKARQEGIDCPAVEQAVSLLAESGVIALAKEKGASFISQGCSSFSGLFGRENSAAEKINTLFTSMIPAIL